MYLHYSSKVTDLKPLYKKNIQIIQFCIPAEQIENKHTNLKSNLCPMKLETDIFNFRIHFPFKVQYCI
jgi:hypothetical protein